MKTIIITIPLILLVAFPSFASVGVPFSDLPESVKKYSDIADGFSLEHLIPLENNLLDIFKTSRNFGFVVFMLLLTCAIVVAVFRRTIRVEAVEVTGSPRRVSNIGLTQDKWDAFMAQKGYMSKTQRNKIWRDTVGLWKMPTLSEEYKSPSRSNPPIITPPPASRLRLNGHNSAHIYDTSYSEPPAPPPQSHDIPISILPQSGILGIPNPVSGGFTSYNGNVYTLDPHGGYRRRRSKVNLDIEYDD